MSKNTSVIRRNRLFIVGLFFLTAVVIVMVLLLFLRPNQPVFGSNVDAAKNTTFNISDVQNRANPRIPDPAPGETRAIMNGSVAPLTYEDLIKQSQLVVRGTVTDKYEELLVQPVGSFGDPICFTDIYFNVSETYRGELKDTTIAVRVLGGTKGAYVLEAPQEASLLPGDECILFLFMPSYCGGSWYTQGDYYEVVGANQGAFYLSGEGLFQSPSPSITKVIDIRNFKDDMSIANKQLPVDYDYQKNYAMNSFRVNLENGMITEDMYNDFVKELSQYATIVG